MHESAANRMRELIAEFCPAPRCVLDVGSYDVNGSYRGFFDPKKTSYLGCDIRQGPNVDVVIGEYCTMPTLSTAGWDLVISGSTLEHCLNPFRLVGRISEVLAMPGGIFIATAPFAWHYHEHPIDCFRYTDTGLRSVCDEAGLEVLMAEMVTIREGRVDSFIVARKDGP